LSASLLTALPQVLTLRADDWDTRLVAMLGEEIDLDAPGQDAVLDRVLDLILVSGLRTWLTRPESPAPDWYRGRSDPAVGQALSLIHDEPGRDWTVASLADRAGVSRATLARRFTDLVGQPPMAYLASWRLALAADLLREPGSTVAAVAHRVGYSSGFALSAAFKRVRGVTPQQHRAG
jgi:AraC-like DNA-binding protein